MDFFETQDVARKHTTRLVVLFALAVLSIIVSTYVVVAGILVGTGSAPGLLHPGLMALVGGGTLLVVGGGSLWKLHQLRGGGRVVAEHLGGKLLVADGADWKARRLLNVVDEMAIASGIPAPAVYLLDKEPGINAFAAGYTPDDAVLGVTQGCLDRLNREQLQGVIAHEFSHVLNGDMRISLRLIGVLHGILVIGLLGYGVLRMAGHSRMRTSRRDSKGGGGVAAVLAIAIGLIVIGFVGVFCGNLIKAAVSRQREYLADASGVQFTRNPDGLAGALKAIGAAPAGSKLAAPHAAEASHMFFAKGLGSGLSSMLATHPPLSDRIRRLDPAWDGTFPEAPADGDEAEARGGPGVGAGSRGERSASGAGRQPVRRSGFGGPGSSPADFAILADAVEALDAAEAAAAAKRDAARGKSADALPRARAHGVPADVSTQDRARSVPADGAAFARRTIERAGRPTPAHVDRAAELISDLPYALRTAGREAWGARAVIFALLVHHDGAAREAQLARLQALADPGLAEFTRQILPEASALPQALRLPLVDLTVPALRALSPAQHDEFLATLDDLFAADGSMDLFEWALQRVLRHHLASARGAVAPPRESRASLGELPREVGVLLSALARAGAAEAPSAHRATPRPTAAQEAAASAALQRSAATLGLQSLTLASPADSGPSALDAALDKLAALHPLRKRELLEACSVCIVADGQVRISEVELLRAFADGLGVPLPPMLPER